MMLYSHHLSQLYDKSASHRPECCCEEIFFLLDTLSAELDARNNFRVVADFSNIAALSWSRKNIVAKMCVVEGPARFQASEDYIRTSEAMAGSIQYISSVSNGGAKSGASAQHCGPSFKSEAIHNMILFL